MKLLEGFRKLLGQAGEAVGQAAGAGVMGGVGRGAVNMMRRPQQSQDNQITNDQVMRGRLPIQQLENRPQLQPAQKMQYAPPMARRPMQNMSEYSEQPLGPQVRQNGLVAEDDAFGYTNDGIQPLSNMNYGESWQPMYELPPRNGEGYEYEPAPQQGNPFQRLMRRR